MRSCGYCGRECKPEQVCPTCTRQIKAANKAGVGSLADMDKANEIAYWVRNSILDVPFDEMKKRCNTLMGGGNTLSVRAYKDMTVAELAREIANTRNLKK